MEKSILVAAILYGLALPPCSNAAETQTVDVLVLGATPGGIAAAISASNSGASVLLIEPTGHVGGLTTSGLSHTDYHTYEGLSGAFLDLTRRVEDYYRKKYGEDSPQHRSCQRGTQAEPHVNELVFQRMLAERKTIDVRKGITLSSIQMTAGKDSRRSIAELVFTRVPPAADLEATKLQVVARVVIDATYEGDLMAMAGVEYHVGREGQAKYDESLAPEKPDSQLQAYNFRFIVTNDARNRVEFKRPKGYSREDFSGLLPFLKDGSIESVFGYPNGCVIKAELPRLPNNKYTTNDVSRSHVRQSMPGENLEWPEGDVADRARVFGTHVRYNVGMLWFLQQDEAVPESFRKEAQQWGWCKDEFTDNDHLPWQLYVREARRMVGDRVFTEHDTDGAAGDARSVLHLDSIACGEYGLNCHGTGHTGPRIGGRHSGEFYKSIAPYQIPYGVIVPSDVDNLLVPVACSSSHVGFCALRLEPIWMSLGQAAGAAARIAVAENIPVQSVSVPQLQHWLHADGSASIYVSDVPPESKLFEAVQWLGSRGGLHGLSPVLGKYGQRGKNIAGQYYEAFLGHAFNPNKTLTAEVRERWLALIPAASRDRARRTIVAKSDVTRGEAVAILFDAANRFNMTSSARLYSNCVDSDDAIAPSTLIYP